MKYIKNYDGDSITFNVHGVHPIIGEKIVVRLKGVDTPELKTKATCELQKARAAKKLVNNLLKNSKRIDVQNISRGKYFRIVGRVVFDGKDLADILIKNGLALPYDGGRKPASSWCL